MNDPVINPNVEEQVKTEIGTENVQETTQETVVEQPKALTEEEKAKILEDAQKEPAPTTSADINVDELDEFSKALKVRFDAGERLTREDLVRPGNWVAAVDTNFLPGLTEEEKNLHTRLGLKIGQKVSSVTENADGSYNVVGADQSTYTNIKL